MKIKKYEVRKTYLTKIIIKNSWILLTDLTHKLASEHNKTMLKHRNIEKTSMKDKHPIEQRYMQKQQQTLETEKLQFNKII